MNSRVAILWCIVLATLFAAYWPSMHGGMVWDDASHITRPGLRTWDGLKAIWTEPRATQQYYPLTHSAFWIMHKLWGDDTFGYHLVNSIFHGINGTLLLIVLRRLKVAGAIFAAGLFVLHPVQVESVAWITELKNTLSGFFALAAMFVYLRASLRLNPNGDISNRSSSPQSSGVGLMYLASFALFMLGLFSKTAIATWPAAMLVIAWWQTGRIHVRRDVLPLLPFFGAAIVMSWLTVHWEVNVWGAQGKRFDLSPAARLIVAGRATWFYLGSLLWPTNFMFFYPRWQIDPAQWTQYLWPVAVVAAIALAWRLRRRYGRGMLATLLLYGGILLPCLGFFNLYWQMYTFVCDHMQYLACASIFVLIANALCRIRMIVDPQGVISFMIKGAILVLLACLTFKRSGAFKDSETLWQDTIQRNPECWMACNNLGIEYQNAQRFDEAVALLRRAVEIKPDHSSAWTNLGMTFINMNQPDQAMAALDKSLEVNPEVAETHFHRGRVWSIRNNLAEAIESYKEAVRIKPEFAEAHALLGLALAMSNRPADAVAAYETSLKYSPNQIDAMNNLAWLLATTPVESVQNGPRAVALASRAAALAKDEVPELLGTLAAAHARAGSFDQAVSIAQRAADAASSRQRPDFAATMLDRKAMFERRIPYTETALPTPYNAR